MQLNPQPWQMHGTVTLDETDAQGKVLKLVAEANAQRDAAIAAMPRLGMIEDQHKIAGALSHVLLSHHRSICHLVLDLGTTASAFALVRPSIETCVRGLWILLCANPEDIKKVTKGPDGYKPLNWMAQKVELAARRPRMLSGAVADWKMFSDYTHSGLQLTIKNIDWDNNFIRPRFSVDERKRVIVIATAMLMIFGAVFTEALGNPGERKVFSDLAKAYAASHPDFVRSAPPSH